MRYLKKFEDIEYDQAFSRNYNIFDFRNDLLNYSFIYDDNRKKLFDYFIGEGYYVKLIELVDNIYEILEKVDYESIKDRLYYVFDHFPDSKPNVSTVIAYGDYFDIDKDPEDFLTGTFHNILTRNKEFIINRIILDIITPIVTLAQKTFVDKFSSGDLSNLSVKDIKELLSSGYNSSNRYEKGKYDKYSIDTFFEIYKPCIIIEMEGGSIDIIKAETLFDENLPSVLSELGESVGINNVIYPYYRTSRKYKAGLTREYRLKIILE